MSIKERHVGVELYRCFLMLGICFVHSFSLMSTTHSSVSNFFRFCVPGFVFISGWYGIRFRLIKIVRLYCLAFWCCAVVAFVSRWVGIDGVNSLSFGGVVCSAWRGVLGLWFLHAYAFLCCMAPILNAALPENEEIKVVLSRVVPLLFVVFVWGWVRGAPFLRNLSWPSDSALGDAGGYSGLALVGVYVFARLYKKSGLSERLKSRLVLGVGFVCACAAGTHIGSYAFLPLTVLSACVFSLFLRVKISCVGWLVGLLGPSLIAVYFLHVNSLVRHFMLIYDGCLPTFIYRAGFGVLIFIVCLSLDLMRRMVVHTCISCFINLQKRRIWYGN